MDLFFETFLRDRAADLRRIASGTQGEMDADDMAGEAYLMAMEIGEREGRELSFTDWQDQDAILAALWVAHVRQGDWTHRLAARLYNEDNDDDDNSSMVDHIAAPETSDPLMALALEEDALPSAVDESYSQAAAYVVIFTRFGNDRGEVRSYLMLSRSRLYARVAEAIALVRQQASLFDRIERIPDDFMPPPGKAYATRVDLGGEVEQWAWEF